MLVAQPTGGGTARHVAELALGCRNRAIDVRVVWGAPPELVDRRVGEQLRAHDVAVNHVDMAREISARRDAAAMVELRQLVERSSPDVLHLHSSKAGALGRLATIGMRARPVVMYTPHAYSFLAQAGSARRRRYRWLERAMAPLTDHVAAVSWSEAEAAARVGCGRRVSVVPNGVVSAGVARRERVGPLKIGWLARMSWQKNVCDAVTASVVLAKLGFEHELWIGGSGEDYQAARVAIAAAKATWIRLVGEIDNTRAFHEQIDVLLITSRAEGLPYVGLDAMANATPIVAFDVPGVRDLVEHGTTGLLAPAGDPGALAAQLARLARSPSLMRAMADAAQRRAGERFALHRQLDDICELYRELVRRTDDRT